MLEYSGMTMEKALATLNDPQAKSDYENWNTTAGRPISWAEVHLD